MWEADIGQPPRGGGGKVQMTRLVEVQTGLGWTGLGWTRLDWTGLDQARPDQTGLDWTRSDRTGQDWTKPGPDQTRPDWYTGMPVY